MCNKKLLFIVEAMGGGVFTYIWQLANELCNYYDMTIIYGLRPQTPSDYEDKFDKRIKLIYEKNFVRSISLKKDLAAYKDLKKSVKEISPDIIHCHSSKAGVLGRILKIPKDCKRFYTPHGFSFLKEDDSKFIRKIYWLIEKVMAKKKSITIACSVGECEIAKKLNKNATFVNNGINIDENIYSEKNESSYEYDVCTVGRIMYQKNPELFNEIALKMPQYKFLWIGDGEDRGVLTAPNIEISGWLDRKKVVELMITAPVFILPSRWEGLPISILEAMYLKRGVIVSNVIGNRDIVKNGENGFIANSVEEFVVDINKMINDSDMRETMGKNAHQDIRKQYTIKVMAEKYREIYKTVVER